MKRFFLVLAVFLFCLLLKPQCAREQAAADCHAVCADAGYDFEGTAQQTGFLAFRCVCKYWRKLPSDTNRLR